MSIVGLAFYFSLGGNVLIQWGLVPSERRGAKASAAFVIGFIAIAAAAALFEGVVYRHVLTPWGLESLAPVAFLAFIALAVGAARVIRAVNPGRAALALDGVAFQSTLALYAVAMTIGGRFSSAWALLAGGAAAAFGYLAATRFLDDIMERLELEPIPEPFRGAPVRFLTAGLMALAFAGIDANFFMRALG